MALKVKSAADAAKKFVAHAGQAASDYAAAVKDAGQNWQDAASNSEGTYSAGVQAAIGDKRYSRGVQRAGAARYVSQATSVGAQRYPQGVANAGPTYQSRVQPFLDTIAGLQLQPRMPKGDPSNWQRSVQVGQALRQKKLQG